MVETSDAIVVGAGLNGAATAFFLLRQGFKLPGVADPAAYDRRVDFPGAR